MLIDYGADVNYASGELLFRPVVFAILMKNENNLKLLI